MNTLQSIVAKLQESQTVGIVISKPFDNDVIQSAIALYLGLTSVNKQVQLISTQPIKADISEYAQKFNQTISNGSNNLVISFPYTDGAIDKVDYAIQENFFNLIIVPNNGFPAIKSEDVRFTESGGTLDTIILVNINTIQDLGDIYTKNEEIFQKANIITIGTEGQAYSDFHYMNEKASSVSEVVMVTLKELKVEFNKDIATALFNGLTWGTKNFTTLTTDAETFTLASTLMSMGALRKVNEIKSHEIPKAINANQPKPQKVPLQSVQSQNTQKSQTTNNSLRNALLEELQKKEAQNTVHEYPVVDETPKIKKDEENWLKPKILNED